MDRYPARFPLRSRSIRIVRPIFVNTLAYFTFSPGKPQGLKSFADFIR
jgi:hypothetical protein